jgi:hypothetical protein
MKGLFTPKNAALLLLIAYCLDLFWKLINWNDFTRGTPWWALTLALTVRFAFMAGLAWLYLRYKKREAASHKIQS